MKTGQFRFKLFLTVLLMQMLTETFSTTGPSYIREVFVSQARGVDRPSCGTQLQPCKSISAGVWLADNNAHVYIDGTGTQTSPYPCQSSTLKLQGIYANKSLSLIGVQSTVNVKCRDGLEIRLDPSNLDYNGTTINLTNIWFLGSPINAHDVNLQIDSCSFVNGTSAVTLTQSTRSVALTFTNSSCMKSRTCIVAEVIKTSEAKQRKRISVFLRNSRVFGSPNSLPGLDKAIGIHASSSSDYPLESIVFDLFLKNFTFDNNFIGSKGVLYVDLDNAHCTVQLVDTLFQDNSVLSPMINIIASYNSYKVNMSLQKVTFSQSNTGARAIMLGVRQNIITTITSSDFIGYGDQNDGGVVYLKSNQTCDVHIINSNFRNNRGCIYVESRTCKVDIQDSSFLQNKGLSIGILRVLVDILVDAKIKNCHFESNEVLDHGSSLLGFVGQFVNLTVLHSQFVGYSSSRTLSIGDISVTGSIMSANVIFRNVVAQRIDTFYSSSVVAIHAQSGSLIMDECHFNDLHTGTTGGAIYAEFEDSLVDIKNSQFMRARAGRGDGGALYLKGVTTLSLDEVIIQGGISYRGSGSGIYVESANRTMTAYINECHFVNCEIGSAVFIKTVPGILAYISVSDSSFESSSVQNYEDGGCMYLLLNEGQSQVHFTKVVFVNCISHQGSGGALMVNSKGSSQVTFESCTFLNNAAPKGNGGAIMTQFSKDVITKPGCVHDKSSEPLHREWRYRSTVEFTSTKFENNTSVEGGALALSRGQHSFNGCFFMNNFAKVQGGHIMSYADSTSLHIINTTFLQTEREKIIMDVTEQEYNSFTVTSFLVTQSQGPLAMKDSSLESKLLGDIKPLFLLYEGGYISFDNKTSLKCPQGSDLEIQNLTYTLTTEYKSESCAIILSLLQFNCKACSLGYYSLQHGQSAGLKKIGDFQCLPCPFGAECLKNVAAKENYWGYQVPSENPPALNFTYCPAGYCKHPEQGDPLQYNSCHGNRSGILCGQCKENYTETLLSPSCRHNHECDDTRLWGVAVMMLLLMATYLVHKPRLSVFLRRQIFWFRKDNVIEEVPKDVNGTVKSHDNGYLKIVFYFYQVANLILISTSYSKFVESHLLQPVVGFFNFQFRFSSNGFLCPFNGLTVVTKELFLASQVFGVFIMILFCYFCHVLVRKCKSLPPPNLGPYLGALLETMLLGYAVFANTGLKLLRCTTIGEESRLFNSGQVLCYQWWQYLLMVFVGVVVVPFVIILGLGSYWLSKESISVKEFLFGCALPLPYLVYRLASYLFCQQRQPSEESAEWKTCIEDVLFGAFRPREGDSYGALYWESVLTGRRLIIIIIYVSFSDPLCKQLLLTFVCVAILLHHSIVRPFRSTKANNLETASLLCLVAIAIINTFKASFFTTGQDLQGPLHSFAQILDWIQIIILSVVPVICSLLVIICVFSQVVRLCKVMVRLVFACCCRRYFVQERSPLLEPTDPDESTSVET